MEHAYLGPDHSDEEITSALAEASLPARRLGEAQLVDEAAELVAAGKILGWYQGKMEFGPRALGNRSIIADPRRPDMKDILNERIKRRETFRPFAPSVLLEATDQYFEQSYPDPFMLKVYPIRPDKRALIPAVTHVDGTGRLQTVDRRTNPRYWALIKAFERKTGIPLVLNTSFNENEPIVNTPREAIECFLRTRMDALILGDYLLSRVEPGVSETVAETEPTAV
jgi:carbamoyltransferase